MLARTAIRAVATLALAWTSAGASLHAPSHAGARAITTPKVVAPAPVATSVANASPARAAAAEASSSASSKGPGKVFLTADEALALAFAGCEITRSTVYLTDAQKARATKLAEADVDASIARPWVATKDGKLVGTAYLDTHKVRTLAETLFVVVDPEGRVARIEVLAFAEPQEYLPRASWYAQFVGRALDADLRVKGAIRPVTGASLTVNATTHAVRRVLAVHAVLAQTPPRG